MSPSELRVNIRNFVASAFQKTGASYDRPTKAGILAAMSECRKGALQMTNDTKLIEDHWTEMMKLVKPLSG